MIVTTQTQNAKLTGNLKKGNKYFGQVGVTIRKVGKTCPSTCPFLNNGCYSQSGNSAIHEKRSEKRNDTLMSKINEFSPKSKLRLNASGDFLLDGELDNDYVADITEFATARPDIDIWSYTHAWRDASVSDALTNLPENVLVLASIETKQEIKEALSLGFRKTARVVSDVKDIDNKLEVLCPNQSHGVSCADCGLCATSYGKNIAFLVHGSGKNKAAKSVQNRIELATA